MFFDIIEECVPTKALPKRSNLLWLTKTSRHQFARETTCTRRPDALVMMSSMRSTGKWGNFGNPSNT